MFSLLLIFAVGLFGTDPITAKSVISTKSARLPHYKVVAVADGVVVQKNVGDPTKPFKGPFIELLDVVSKGLNFTYDVTAQPDNEYGNNQGPGGKWNGMMGSLVNNKADIAVGSFIGTSECQQVASFGRLPYNLTAQLLINPEFGTKDVRYLVDSKLDLYILSKSPNPRVQKIWQDIKVNNINSTVMSLEEAAPLVAKGKFAFLDHEGKLDEVVAFSNGSLAISSEKIETGLSFAPYAVKKGSAKGEALLANMTQFLELTGSLLELAELFGDMTGLIEDAQTVGK